jgi:hypothetical protein
MSLRLHRVDRPIEWHKISVFAIRIVQDRAAVFHPSMRFEAPCPLICSDTQVRGNSMSPEHPPKDQRLLQAVRAEKQMSRRSSFHANEGVR